MNITLKILRFLGPTFLFFGFFVVFPPLLMSLFSGNTNNTLLYIFIVSMIYSIIILFTLRKKKLNYMPRDGFLITFVCWVLISIVASVPFYSIGMNPSDSFFEAVSGLTTTGSTSINDLSLLSNDILIYRQLLQWAGGVGLVIVVLAIIPAISGGMRVLQAETSGFADKSFSPRLRETARSLLLFYLGITLICCISFYLAGMSFFEAVAHSLSTVSIGGFSLYNENFGYFNSPLIEAIAILFMLVSATNFGLHFLAIIKGTLNFHLRNDEIRIFFLIICFVVLFCISYLFIFEGFSFAEAVRIGAFQSISIVTTTGFTSGPLSDMGAALPLLVLFLAFIGACSGSVGGGMKVWRIIVLFKVGFNNITKLMHPNAVSTTKLNGEKITSSQIESVFSFLTLYIVIFALFLLIIIFQSNDFYSAFSATAAAINNLGPGLGEYESNFSSLNSVGKYALSLAMIIGRLEIFGVLILFIPSYWRN